MWPVAFTVFLGEQERAHLVIQLGDQYLYVCVYTLSLVSLLCMCEV